MKKQKHWTLSLEYSKYKLDGNLGFHDDHNLEYLVGGAFAQDNEIPLTLVVIRIPVLCQSQMGNSLLSLTCPHHDLTNPPYHQASSI